MIKSDVELREAIEKAVYGAAVTDVHTHLYSPCFGDMLLWGVDELVTYHYLIAETFRHIDMPYEKFWNMDKEAQSDLVWQKLFVENSPYSESCRGVLTVLDKLGLDVKKNGLPEYRKFFESKSVDEYVDLVFEMSGVKEVVMTNDPFDETERNIWLNNYAEDDRFKAALRIDPLLNGGTDILRQLQSWGYDVEDQLDENMYSEVRRFLNEWVDRMGAVYMAVSLPPTFNFPEDSMRANLIENCVLPVCREHNIPFAMMIGVKKLINPELQLAGDSVGKSSIDAVEYLCANYPNNKFMVTMLARENQHELCVAARKFRNLLVFGCWWFLNNPSLIDEITRMRFELLGTSVVPQHSDARVLDQLIYKWDHSRKIIADVLYDKYKDIMDTGWDLTEEDIVRDVEKLMSGNFWEFIEKEL